MPVGCGAIVGRTTTRSLGQQAKRFQLLGDLVSVCYFECLLLFTAKWLHQWVSWTLNPVTLYENTRAHLRQNEQ